MRSYKTNNEEQTTALAKKLASELRPGSVVALRGGLGAGKTAFVRGLAQGLGIVSDVSSPTFALVHSYSGEDITLYHFDMYRIETFEDLYSTGFFDYLEEGAIIAIEWSENIEAVLPKNTITVTINRQGEEEREILVEVVSQNKDTSD